MQLDLNYYFTPRTSWKTSLNLQALRWTSGSVMKNFSVSCRKSFSNFPTHDLKTFLSLGMWTRIQTNREQLIDHKHFLQTHRLQGLISHMSSKRPQNHLSQSLEKCKHSSDWIYVWRLFWKLAACRLFGFVEWPKRGNINFHSTGDSLSYPNTSEKM